MINIGLNPPFDTGGGEITGYMVQLSRKISQSGAFGNDGETFETLDWEKDPVDGADRWHIAYDGRDSTETSVSIGRLN